MAGNLSSSSKRQFAKGADRLSTLPPEIQSQILSRLPTIDAARVGLLSKSLRSACYSLSKLSFDYCLFPETKNNFSFVNFIDQTIAHHDESDVTTLELWLWPFYNCQVPIKSLWVRFAIKHRVKKLVLYGEIDKTKLPDQLFTCLTLVKLELAMRDLVLTSEDLALPNLQKLKLKFLKLAGQTLGNDLFPNLPALRKLSLVCCDFESPRDISISSEKLEEFIFYCPWMYDSALTLRAPSLTSLVCINYDEEKCDFDVVYPSGLQFFVNGGEAVLLNGGINDLSPTLIKVTKELFKSSCPSLSHWLIEYLSMAYNLLKQATPGQFHGTLMLNIKIWPIMDHLMVLSLLVSRCPTLIKLNIVFKTPQRRALQLPSEDYLVEYGTVGGLRSVQLVEIENFGGGETQLMFVRFLLANMIDLHHMGIVLGDLTGKDRRLTIFEILEYERASKVAKVSFG